MTAIRRQLIRRIQRETGKDLWQVARSCQGLSALDIARRFARPAPVEQR